MRLGYVQTIRGAVWCLFGAIAHSLYISTGHGILVSIASSSVLVFKSTHSQEHSTTKALYGKAMSQHRTYISVLVDGYVSKSYGPKEAERYFQSLLKSNSVPDSCRDGHSFVVTSVPHHIRTQFPTQNAWVLDRGVMGPGTVVPQILWTPQTITDRRQHVAEAQLQLPIFFVHTNGSLGLSLETAISGRCHNLVHAQYCAPLGPQTTTHIRIGWPGYHVFRRQVQIRDETPQKNTVTLSKFAQHVGRSVEAFLKACHPENGNPVPKCLPDFENPAPKWRVGGREGIQPNEIMIIGAIHVSSGSWMPILQLNHYIL